MVVECPDCCGVPCVCAFVKSVREHLAECCGCSCERCKHQGGDGHHTKRCQTTFQRLVMARGSD